MSNGDDPQALTPGGWRKRSFVHHVEAGQIVEEGAVAGPTVETSEQAASTSHVLSVHNEGGNQMGSQHQTSGAGGDEPEGMRPSLNMLSLIHI